MLREYIKELMIIMIGPILVTLLGVFVLWIMSTTRAVIPIDNYTQQTEQHEKIIYFGCSEIDKSATSIYSTIPL